VFGQDPVVDMWVNSPATNIISHGVVDDLPCELSFLSCDCSVNHWITT